MARNRNGCVAMSVKVFGKIFGALGILVGEYILRENAGMGSVVRRRCLVAEMQR